MHFRRSPAYYRCSLRFSGRPLVGMAVIRLGLSAVARLLPKRLSALICVVTRMSTSAATFVRQACSRSTGSTAMEPSDRCTGYGNMCAICQDIMCSSDDLLHTMCCGLRQRQTRVGKTYKLVVNFAFGTLVRHTCESVLDSNVSRMLQSSTCLYCLSPYICLPLDRPHLS